jgi:hypothetical protein
MKISIFQNIILGIDIVQYLQLMPERVQEKSGFQSRTIPLDA